MSEKDFSVLSPKSNQETVTPHRISVALLIQTYIKFRETNFAALTDFEQAKYRKSFSIVILKLIQSPDLSLDELKKILHYGSYELSARLLLQFHLLIAEIAAKDTGNMLDELDSLSRLMPFNDNQQENAKPFEEKILISKSSVIGFYLRRLIINIDKLSFSEVTQVHIAFRKYYQKYSRSCEIIVNSEKNNSDIHIENWFANKEQWSRRQAELFIATQAALLSNNEEKALSPSELQKRILGLLQSNPELSEAHFLSFLNYVRVKEFCGAVDSLYHCFDKSAAVDSKGTTDEKNKGYRFAALNLAILHYHFGHYGEALASLKEAINIAQEANDNVCLQHALTWLYRLTHKNKDKLITHCILKSFELNLTYTKSLGLQTLGHFSCQNSGDPLITFEVLAESDLINSQHNHGDLISNSYSLKSALWQFYGKTEMSSLWSQLILYLNIDMKLSNKAFYGEGYCIAICNVANQILLQGDHNLVHAVLSFVKSRFPNGPNSSVWMLCENIFTYVRSFHHEKWTEAEAAARKIMSLDKYEGYLRLSELYYYKQDFIGANQCINKLLEMLERDSYNNYENFYYIRAKILLAEVQFSSGFLNAVPSAIITILNNCLVETNKNHLDYYTAIVHLHIAHIQLSMGLTSQALKLLDICLVQILAHGGCFDRARATLLFVKCLVADSERLNSEERKKVILNATQLLNKAKDDFEKVEAFSRVKDVLYLQAQLFNSLQMNPERNTCAYEFKLLEEKYTTKNTSTLVKYL